MRLEDIVSMYGWNDYLDQNSGYVYELSKASIDTDNKIAHVPVCDGLTREFIGTAVMKLN